MDKKYLNVLLGAGALIGGYFLFRYFYKNSQVPDELTIELSDINNGNQSFNYVVMKNGSEFKKGVFTTMMPSEAFIQFKNKIQFINNLDSVTIIGTSSDKEQFRKIIKFKRSTDPKVPTAELEATVIDVKPK